MDSVKPYSVSVPQRKLELLQQKLALTSFPDEVNITIKGSLCRSAKWRQIYSLRMLAGITVLLWLI